MVFTPMMTQYFKVKEKCQDCILFFRLGDFYEMFFKDAELASRELELTLTGRDCGTEERAPMCGIPYHAAEGYIAKLIAKGYKVAICEQLEDPSLAKGIVERGIIKVITPGTFTDAAFLQDNKNNYIMCIYIEEDTDSFGLAISDLSTGEFFSTYSNLNNQLILDEVCKYNPSEILVEENINDSILKLINDRFSLTITKKRLNYFTDDAEKNVKEQFENYNDYNMATTAQISANGLLNYVYETQKQSMSNLKRIECYSIGSYMSVDSNTRANLELVETIRDKSKKGSLLHVLDKTSTAMGARLLRRWVEQPLLDKNKICLRLNAVEELLSNGRVQSDMKECLKKVYDIERIVGRISTKSVNAKELLALSNSLRELPHLKRLLGNFSSQLLKNNFENMDVLADVYELLDKAINENPPLSFKEGGLIKTGYNSEVDELRKAKTHGKEWIAALESREREFTGIKSLKLGYNKVFGYYIEITKSNYDAIPEGRYIRKQTLANAERFITQELKEMEDKILGSEEKLINLEYSLFVELREKIESEVERMKATAKIVSTLDCLISLSDCARENNYVKPTITEDGVISIEEGRHPVVESVIPTGSFVSNNTFINNKESQLILITGPNMAGKSTYMRQVALIVLMSQIGSFVPSKKASISVVDKIFTRIGASDDLAAGKSTFMVEMWEVSNILKNATHNSLVLLDEVGRGTSTYDGLSIAWSVIEYICSKKNLRFKTLFATHYHELTKLEGNIKGLKNYSIAVKKIGDEIVFLRKIIEGSADESYGIEVAMLAGLPEEVTSRAKDILAGLEKNNENRNNKALKEAAIEVNKAEQIGFNDFQKENLFKEISEINILNLTPMDTMNKLYEIVNKAKGLY